MKNTFPIILAALDLSAQDKQILKVLKTVGELTASEKSLFISYFTRFFSARKFRGKVS